MSTTIDHLYDLLPSVYRLRDARLAVPTDEGVEGPLQALLTVLAEQGSVVERDIAALYESWFIETCPEWVVPYIGDLLAARALHPVAPGTFSARSYVANTLGYRRRKGTAAVLEQLARDVTGWPARAVEFFQLLGTTQHLNHVRAANVRTPDLRDGDGLELLGSPFEGAAHTGEVRRIPPGRGRYNVPNVGLFLWRLQSYPVTLAHPRAVADPPDGRYRFDPLGADVPLFNVPAPEPDIGHLAGEREVPGALRRSPPAAELEALRGALARGEAAPAARFFDDLPIFGVAVDDILVPTDQIMVCHLGDPPAPVPEGWRRPPTTREYPGGSEARTITVGVDPVLGRLAFPEGVTPGEVRVSYAYGFSGDMGAGPFDRSALADRAFSGDVEATWQIGVTRDLPPEAGTIVSTLAEAVAEWNTLPPGTVGVISIMDSSTYVEDLTGPSSIEIPTGSHLLIVAAEWPEVEGPSGPLRQPGKFVASGLRPHVLGDVSIVGTADGGLPGEMLLNGILLEGSLTVRVGDLGRLGIAACTLVPAAGGLRVNASADESKQNGSLRIEVERSICGPVGAADPVPRPLRIVESLVDGAGGVAIDVPGAEADVQWSTILGTSLVRSLEAGNSIFTGTVAAERRQVGCVRFSSVPDGSTTPRRYRCQPDLALDGVADPVARDAVRARLRPALTSLRLGDPGYGQLHGSSAQELRTGAEDGSEMGAFGFLKQPLREANLRAVLDEYLRFGLEAGPIHVT